MKKRQAIDSYLAEYFKLLIGDRNQILDLFMENKWLVAILDSGVRVKIKQQYKGYANRI